MKVNSKNNRDISFKGFYNSRALKKGLAFAEKNGALFASATTVALSMGVRPLAILATPKTDKQNKKIACAKSITSSLLEFAITYLISRPVVNSVCAIDKNPKKYLKPETISMLKETGKELADSKAYVFATQLFKLGLGFAIAAPKSILTAIGMPYVLEAFFNKDMDELNIEKESKSLVFKGNSPDSLAKFIGKLIDKKSMNEFCKKNKDTNFPMHIIALKDSLATGTFIYQVSKSKKINEERKKPLINNSFISTALSIVSGYTLDKCTEKPSQKFIEKFKQINYNDANLEKYLNGFKIAKPVVIIGFVYYAIIPLISTFFAERITTNKSYSESTKPSLSAATSINR